LRAASDLFADRRLRLLPQAPTGESIDEVRQLFSDIIVLFKRSCTRFRTSTTVIQGEQVVV